MEKTAAAKSDAEAKGGDTGDFEDIDVGSIFLKFDSGVNSLELSKLTKDLEKSLGDSGVKIKANSSDRKLEITGINNVGDAKALSKAFNDNAEQIKATGPKKPLGGNSKSLETLGAAGGLSQDVGKSFKVDVPKPADKADDKGADDKGADDKSADDKGADDKGADDKKADDKGSEKGGAKGGGEKVGSDGVPNKAFTKGALTQASDHLDKALSKGGMPDSVKSAIEGVKSKIEKMKGKD